jgi:hypothetical protein
MRLIGLLAAILLSVAAAPIYAQNIPELTLAPGDAVIVHVSADGRAVLPERHRAEWSALDVYAARHLTGLTPPDAPVALGTPLSSGPDGPRPETIADGQVRVRFLSIDNKQSLLVVENGLKRSLAYRARMTVSGQTRPTDVCVVLAGFPSYEHWPHPIEGITLRDFRYVSADPGQPPTCR